MRYLRQLHKRFVNTTSTLLAFLAALLLVEPCRCDSWPVFDLNQITMPPKSINRFHGLAGLKEKRVMKPDAFPRPVAVALGIAFATAFSFFVVFALSGIKSQLFGTQEYDHRRAGDAMLFPDWLAITVLVLLLVWAVSAWIRQHKS